MQMYYEIARQKYSNQIPLEEAYFGKTPDIMKLEKKIGSIRSKYRDNPVNVNTSRDLAEFNTMVEDVFGFKIFNMIIVQQGLANACTLPISSTIGAGNQKKHLKKTKNGLSYDKSANYSTSVFINSGLFFSNNYTDGEIMAIIMHEIGHNFYEAVSKSGQMVSYVNQLITAFTFPIQFLYAIGDPQVQGTIAMSTIPGMKDKWLKFIARKRKKNPDSCKAFDSMCAGLNGIKGMFFVAYDVFSTVIGMLNPVGAIQAALQNFILQLINMAKNPLELITNMLGIRFKNEAHSDQFATMYGYGGELNTALTKMNQTDMGLTYRTDIRNTPILGAYFDFIMTPSYILNGMINEHPNDVYRAKSTIDRLKKELEKNNNFDARMKKEINNQIKEIEKSIDTITNVDDMGHFYSNAYRKLLLTMFGGDFRGFFSKDIDDMYDKVFNSIE